MDVSGHASDLASSALSVGIHCLTTSTSTNCSNSTRCPHLKPTAIAATDLNDASTCSCNYPDRLHNHGAVNAPRHFIGFILQRRVTVPSLPPLLPYATVPSHCCSWALPFGRYSLPSSLPNQCYGVFLPMRYRPSLNTMKVSPSDEDRTIRPRDETTGKKTYNSGDSLVVTDPTTNPPLTSLSMGERTGSRVL
ncbi:unnamed protein product [Fusarium graminearum]|uniref:Uncharacterized protein n=1 Tax=Gibberella zeae TaxID=5518 RepID=A0A4U9FDN7_GIBZA|nr:unnamed protein product [Fusarium graminearum]VTO91725.1 unnamed protein product [Fusarium graminearum]